MKVQVEVDAMTAFLVLQEAQLDFPQHLQQRALFLAKY
jgi:hypothetical protein